MSSLMRGNGNVSVHAFVIRFRSMAGSPQGGRGVRALDFERVVLARAACSTKGAPGRSRGNGCCGVCHDVAVRVHGNGGLHGRQKKKKATQRWPDHSLIMGLAGARADFQSWEQPELMNKNWARSNHCGRSGNPDMLSSKAGWCNG